LFLHSTAISLLVCIAQLIHDALLEMQFIYEPPVAATLAE